MTVQPKHGACAGAASREPVDWQAIDWRHVNRNVRRLQARIVQATQDGRWGKVRFYNRQRLHLALDYQSPVAFEEVLTTVSW